MSSFLFSLNAVAPVFLLMVLGMFFRKIHVVNDEFAGYMNKFVFNIALPVMLFQDLATTDIEKDWDGDFVLFCVLATLLSVAIVSVLSLLMRDREGRGEFIQGSFRSSATLLGAAFVKAIYGTEGIAPMMILAAAPIYNIMAVIILAATEPARDGKKQKIGGFFLRQTLLKVIKNPLIIGIVTGFLWSALSFQEPEWMSSVCTSLSNMATPMGLIAMGASFSFSHITDDLKPVCSAVFLKLIGLPAIFVPAAVACGFKKEELVAILVMLAAPTTVSSFVMAKTMGHKGNMTGAIVALTTAFSAITLTVWITIIKNLGYI
ncbi:MAG: AEC family transporter [Bilifractor sp.]